MLFFVLYDLSISFVYGIKIFKIMNNSMSLNRDISNLESTFGVIYSDYYDRILSFVLKKVGCKDDAEDITSSVFMKAFQKFYTYECRGKGVGAWLYRIAINETNQYFRNKKNNTIGLDLLVSKDFFDELDKDELVEKLGVALGRISESNLQLIKYRYFEKLSYAEIAEKLFITENNAKVKCHRSILKLKVVFSNL